ncbi:hypothetical protein A4R26_31475 [Niastella populi]|uniref:Outer membrane protein beta-barrel domain-containing protein n=2 Tax=Niastella populi TaxID=550983 RepID=A0A1V9EPV4_9BACT|nr:hypothetical protein A4R26_31475 [Niastella populi]
MTSQPFNKFRIMMKFTMVTSVLFCTVAANAQTWHFGVKADISYSALKGEGIKNKFAPGFQAGGFATYNITKQWAIQPELLYSFSQYKKGSDFLTYYNNYGRSAAGENISLASISVPLLVRYNLNKTLSFLAGPQYSYLVWDDESLLKNDRQAFRNSEFSANIGVQVNIEKVGFYARYNKGLSDINDIDDRYEWKSSHVQAGVAVRFQ